MKPSTKPLSPLEKGDHPEMNDSEFLDDNGTQTYQSLVGVLQWSISIGWFDITTAVMTMLSFQAQPHLGHLEHIKQICGYLYKLKDAAMQDWWTGLLGSCWGRIRMDEHRIWRHLWDSTQGCPSSTWHLVMLSHYVDANLYHDMLTGGSVTGILHYLNKTPINWCILG